MPVTPSEIDMDVDESRSLGEPVAPITHFTHPYEAELRKLVYLDRQMVDASRLTPRQPVHLPSHPFLYVESLEAFNTMYQELSLDSVHEIAIDLEHHSLRYCDIVYNYNNYFLYFLYHTYSERFRA